MPSPKTSAYGLLVVNKPLRELMPDRRNARRHSPGQINKVRASLNRFGWTNPILTAAEKILAGHARYTAAIAMAQEGQSIRNWDDPWEAPTIDLGHLTHAEQRAYMLADNRIAEEAGWDRELLQLEMMDLSLEGFDLSLTGFADVQVDTLLGRTDPNAGKSKLTGGLRYQVVIDCPDGEAQQTELLSEMRSRHITARPLIL